MRLSESKKQKLRKLLRGYIEDMELIDVEIHPTGYREYDIDYFATTLDVDKILNEIIDIIEE